MRNPHRRNEPALVPGADRDLNVNDAPGCSPGASLSALQPHQVATHISGDQRGSTPSGLPPQISESRSGVRAVRLSTLPCQVSLPSPPNRM